MKFPTQRFLPIFAKNFKIYFAHFFYNPIFTSQFLPIAMCITLFFIMFFNFFLCDQAFLIKLFLIH